MLSMPPLASIKANSGIDKTYIIYPIQSPSLFYSSSPVRSSLLTVLGFQFAFREAMRNTVISATNGVSIKKKNKREGVCVRS
jgi:hypothetical protein